jgi:Lipocalin-like domain
MKQRTVFGLSAMLAVGLLSLPDSINAQQKSLREQLIGAWMLVSCDAPYCVDAHPSGILIFDGSGRYAQVFASRGRPKFSNPGNRRAVPAEEYKAAAMGLVANFGTWSVNEADKTLTSHVDGALSPNIEGSDGKDIVVLSGDELKLITPSVLASGGRSEEVYQRAK